MAGPGSGAMHQEVILFSALDEDVSAIDQCIGTDDVRFSYLFLVDGNAIFLECSSGLSFGTDNSSVVGNKINDWNPRLQV